MNQESRNRGERSSGDAKSVPRTNIGLGTMRITLRTTIPASCFPDSISMSEPMIEVEGLTKRFGAFTAVDHISFTVGKGSIFGFLGPNGSGKQL